MNKEIEQQQKFEEQFAKLANDASQRFKDKWDKRIDFINPTRDKWIPAFNPGSLQLLSADLRAKYELLRKRYFDKSL